MGFDLAIRIHLITLYTVLLSIFLAVLLFFKVEFYWHLVFLVFLLIPESVMTGMVLFVSKRKKLLMSITLILATQFGLLFTYIKQLRAEFSPTPVGVSGIAAYTQFSGYPFWFDTVVFLLLVSLPVLCILMYRVTHAVQKHT
jgi:hypothetical protein